MMKDEIGELQKVLENLRVRKFSQISKELVMKVAEFEEKYMTDRKYAMREIEKLVDEFIEGDIE